MKIEHLGIYVANLDAARQFFERYFSAACSALYCRPPRKPKTSARKIQNSPPFFKTKGAKNKFVSII